MAIDGAAVENAEREFRARQLAGWLDKCAVSASRRRRPTAGGNPIGLFAWA